MRLLPKSIHRCRRYPTKFNSGRDIPGRAAVADIGIPRYADYGKRLLYGPGCCLLDTD